MDVDSPSPPSSTAPKNVPEEDSDSDDSDPIVSSYAVFTNPAPASTRKLLILQHPNKQGQERHTYHAPSEVRIKPGAGMIEVDLPLSYHDGSYDRDKGMRWGQALQRSMNQKSGGSHGLAGGFGVGVPAPRAGARRKDEDREIYDWTEAVRRDQVLRTQTLGGQYTGRNTGAQDECRWMVGVFKGGNLHLTPAQSEIQLRPQLHHLDAMTEHDRLTRPRDGGPGQGPGGPSKDGSTVGGPSSGGPGPAAPAPKAITMTIKSSGTAGGADQPTTETMADRLRHVQTEAWQRLRYVDEEDADAWELYNRTLIYRSPEQLQQRTAGSVSGEKDKGDKDKGKGKGKEEAAKLDEDEKEALESRAARLLTRWAEEDYLRAVAGKDRQGVLEGYGDVVLPGIKPDDVVEDGVAVKKENAEGGASSSTAGAKKTAAAGAAAKGKGKAAAPTKRAPAKGKGPVKATVEID